MAYGIQTPSLASIASPYRQEINDVITGAYDFKDRVRTDFLKDAYVPSRVVGAELDMANNLYGLNDRRNTFENDLASSYGRSQLGRMSAEGDVSMYPTMRGLRDQTAIYGGISGMYDAESGVEERRNAILERNNESEYQSILASAPGSDPLDRAQNAYNTIIEGQMTPGVRSIAENNLMNAARRTLDTVAPGSPEYERAANVLRRFGQYGAITTVPQPVPQQQPSPIDPSTGLPQYTPETLTDGERRQRLRMRPGGLPYGTGAWSP